MPPLPPAHAGQAATPRIRSTADDDRFHDVLYAEFMKDPAGAVKALYDRFDLGWSEELGDRIRRYVARRPQDRGHGRHVYRFEDTGLDAAEERAHFADYQAQYSIPNES